MILYHNLGQPPMSTVHDRNRMVIGAKSDRNRFMVNQRLPPPISTNKKYRWVEQYIVIIYSLEISSA